MDKLGHGPSGTTMLPVAASRSIAYSAIDCFHQGADSCEPEDYHNGGGLSLMQRMLNHSTF